MPKIEVTQYICDECDAVVDTDTMDMIDASVYDAVFHATCWKRIGGPRVAQVLGLGDIDRVNIDGSITDARSSRP